MIVKADNSLKLIIQEFNEQTKKEFDYLRDEKYDLLRNKTWLNINGIPAIHSKYSPQQQKYALEKCLEIGIRATARLINVNRRTLQIWCRYYDICIPRYPEWMESWADRKRRRRDFWRLRGY